MLWEARGGLKGAEDNRVTTRLLLYPLAFSSFLFLSTRVLFSLAGYAQSMPAHIVSLSQAEA